MSTKCVIGREQSTWLRNAQVAIVPSPEAEFPIQAIPSESGGWRATSADHTVFLGRRGKLAVSVTMSI